MAEQSGHGTPKLARTDFESMTHEQLAALLESASSEGASLLATKLAKASATITGIGDDLMTYVKGLEWQGEGGDAFRDWGGQSAAATLRLGQYAEVASRFMATVAQAVAEAKAAMPPTSETTQAKADLADARKTIAAAQDPGARNDPDARKLAQTAQSDATAAQQRMEAARAEAIQQLRKLAQTYEYSAQQVNSVPPPTFAPPAAHMTPSHWYQPADYLALGTGGSGTTTTTMANSGPGVSGERSETLNPARPSAAAGPPPLAATAGREQAAPPPPAAMNIDGVTSLPEARNTAPLNTTAPPNSNAPRPENPHAVPPLVVQPTRTGRGGLPGPLTPPQSPPNVRPSLLPGQAASGGSVPRPPRETGIIGGRPVSPTTGRPPNGLPRGTVIGSDSSQGRMPLGRVSSSGIPMGAGPHTGPGTAYGSRRLASQPSGVLGSRPAQPGTTGSRPFTPGGAGLVRRPPSAADPNHGPVTGRTGGTVAPTRQSVSRRSNPQDETQQRPDYLAEEEETWANGNRRTVPRVVD